MCHFVGRAHPFKINCVTQLDHGPKRKKSGEIQRKKIVLIKKCSLASESQICFKVSSARELLFRQFCRTVATVGRIYLHFFVCIFKQ